MRGGGGSTVRNPLGFVFKECESLRCDLERVRGFRKVFSFRRVVVVVVVDSSLDCGIIEGRLPFSSGVLVTRVSRQWCPSIFAVTVRQCRGEVIKC